MAALEERILAASIPFQYSKASELLSHIRALLLRAVRDEWLSNTGKEVLDLVRMSPAEQGPGAYVIVGGEKDFKRDPSKLQLRRTDGAWLHFSIALRVVNRVELIAYDYELVFRSPHVPPFLRFDLNPPGHPNEIRCHVHPGNDDLLAPAPLMNPKEVLELFVVGMRPRNPDKPRVQR
jgi:hypothetical protein